MNYRTVEPADYDAIARVWLESARSSDGALSSLPSLAALRSRVDAEMAAGWDVTIVLDDDVIVGFLALKPAFAALDQIFILPTHQDRGIGRALIERAKAAMPSGFTLRTASANHKARRLYGRSGLLLLEEGFHPKSGYSVCYYSWNTPP